MARNRYPDELTNAAKHVNYKDKDANLRGTSPRAADPVLTTYADITSHHARGVNAARE